MYDLLFRAELDNIESLKPDQNDIRFYMRVRCSNCGEENDKWVYVDPSEEVEVVRSTVNLAVKCKICARTNTVDLVKDSVKDYSSPDEWQVIASFDCRGIEPTEYEMRAGYTAVCESGSKFPVVFEDGEFCEFDEASGNSVSIFSPEGKFEQSKKK